MTREFISIAVRELAGLVHRRGDIHIRFERGTTGAEGVATQKRVQSARYGEAEDYVREHPVSLDFSVAGQPWRLSGRVDGCNPSVGLVEEYKTTRADIERIHAHLGHVHRAQLLLYGGLLALAYLQIERWQLKLCYCHPEQDELLACYAEEQSGSELQEFLQETLDVWSERLLAHHSYLQGRDLRLATLEFPFERFRPHQRALAGKVYSALKEGTNLLLEAATGTGKSLATLYPAYRALADTALNRVFFLTSRTTGQDAAQAAAGFTRSGEPGANSHHHCQRESLPGARHALRSGWLSVRAWLLRSIAWGAKRWSCCRAHNACRHRSYCYQVCSVSV